MRIALLALLTLALAPSVAPAQGSWAEKMFKQGVSHDFGNVARGAQLFHQFKITNIYAARLEILPPRTNCGCVTVTPSTRVLEPRQEATIDVLMDARRFTGPKTVTIYLTVGPEYVSTATISVSANARADVVFNPGHVSFGVVPRGQTPTKRVTVEYAGTLNWHVTDVVAGEAPFSVKLKEYYRRPGQVGYDIEVTLKPDAPGGSTKHELQLKTDDPASPLVPLLVEATVQAPLSVSPSNVNLGSLRIGDTLSRKVIVKGSGQPFRVLAVEGQTDGIKAELPPTPASIQVVTLEFRPDKAGDFRRQLQIKTDLPGEAPATVMVEGRVEQK